MGDDVMLTAVRCKQCGKTYSAGVVQKEFQGLCPACIAAFAFDEISQSPLESKPQAADTDKTTIYLKPGTIFQGVEVLSVLGQGGMGVVYKARQLGLDRPVALKLMTDRLAGDPDFVKRFEKEAKAMATLSHPNIVAVYNFGCDAGRCFIVMEFVDGANLRHLLRERRLPPEEALKIVPQLCDALEYAHGEGVVHRDIKPENILIDRKGRVKITDFGLAKMAAPDRKDGTLTGLVMGTPHYMAPEQVETPKSVDHRADIYSMGVVFYELLTGELPLGRFQLPSQRGAVDARLDPVVLRALEKEPDRRYQRASEMKIEVSRVSEFIPVARLSTRAVPPSPLPPPRGARSFAVPSPAAANAGWTAPPGLAPIRPNTPLHEPRLSGWVGTGFGLTLASIVLAMVGLLVAGVGESQDAMVGMYVVFGIGGLLATFGFLCAVIGTCEILFHSDRRKGFGLAFMTFAMDALWIGVAMIAFLVARTPGPEPPRIGQSQNSADSFPDAPLRLDRFVVNPPPTWTQTRNSLYSRETVPHLFSDLGVAAEPAVVGARYTEWKSGGATIRMAIFEYSSTAARTWDLDRRLGWGHSTARDRWLITVGVKDQGRMTDPSSLKVFTDRIDRLLLPAAERER